jgi:hypothetical protein
LPRIKRKAVGQDELELAVPDLGIQKIDAGGMDLDHQRRSRAAPAGTFRKPQGAAFPVAIDQE